MGTAVIPGCDTPPVLQFAERIFNEMPTVIQCLVERKGLISGFPGRDADVMPLAFRDSRNYTASYPPSTRKVLLSGRRRWRIDAPCNR